VILSEPLCLSKTASRTNNFEAQSISHAVSRWNTNSSSSNCQLLASTNTSADNDEDENESSNSTTTSILQQSVVFTWEDFAPSQSPTSTFSPTLSSAPSVQPSFTPHPSASLVPSQSPMGLSCFDESLNLLAVVSVANPEESENSEDEDETNKIQIAKEITQAQNLMMMGGGNTDDNSSEGFARHCSSINAGENNNGEDKTDAAAVAATADAYCEFDYQNAVNATDTQTSIASLCRSVDAIYVEDSVWITCTSEEKEDLSSPTTTTKVVVRNKPSCRSKKCNADGVRELATVEFERWIKLKLETGSAGSSSSSILLGTQSCVIDEVDQEGKGGVSVTVGVASTGSGDNSPTEPTDQCLKGTGFVKSLIDVYNQNTIAEREFLDYVDTDLRQICGSPQPNVLECNFDWNKLFPSSTTNMKSSCMPDEFYGSVTTSKNSTVGCGGSGGQYVESSFRMSCANSDGTLSVISKHVPECIGKPCSPGQTWYLLAEKYALFTDQFVEDFGRFPWSCTVELLSVYAALFDPADGTDDIECYKNLQFEEIVAKEIDAEISSAFSNASSTAYDSVKIETEPPIEAPPTFPSPKYDSLFVPVGTDAPVETSSTTLPITFSGTIIVLMCQVLFLVEL